MHHVPLLEPIGPVPPPCPHCLAPDDPRIAAVLANIASLDPQSRALQESMHRLQRALRSVVSEQRRIAAELTALSGIHPRCALCRRPTGPGHGAGSTLHREKYGPEQVCEDCHAQLSNAHQSAASQLQTWWQEDKDEAAEPDNPTLNGR